MQHKGDNLYGILAEFDDPERLVEATERAREHGYRQLDAYTPYPVHGLAAAAGLKPTRLPLIVFGGGVLGALTGYGLQYVTTVLIYPHNIGGRPLHSWTAFIPITFELTVLFAALSGVLAMIVLNGLPRPYHPVFNVPAFKRASQDRFFLCLKASDPLFDYVATRQFLEGLQPCGVQEVPR